MLYSPLFVVVTLFQNKAWGMDVGIDERNSFQSSFSMNLGAGDVDQGVFGGFNS